MKFLVFTILIIITLNVSAQVHKKFFNKNGKITKDSTKAVSYLLYQKEGPDSLWSTVKLNIRNIPIEKGTYLDDDLTIPYGKFVYYQTIVRQKKVDSDHVSIDTSFVIIQTGFFINGLKEGIWLDYYINGRREYLKTYENNVLNGLYEDYYGNGKLYERGYYINGLKEGDWYVFREDSTVKIKANFKHNFNYEYKEYGNNDQWYGANPGFNFEYYIYKYLKKLGLPPAHGCVIIAFTITSDGHLIDPQVNTGVNPVLDQAIVEALKSCPKWEPAKLNNKRIDQQIKLGFEYDNAKDNNGN